MTDLSATPTQQLARIADLEQTLMDEFEDTGDQADMRWLCALARKGVEAQPTIEMLTASLESVTITMTEAKDTIERLTTA